MKTKTIIWTILLALLALTVWKLQRNKVKIDSEAQLSMVGAAYVPVKVIKPKEGGVGNSLQASGIFFPKKEMWVLSQTQGEIREVFKDRGDYVREGEVLAKVDDELLKIEEETIQINIDKLQKDKQRLTNLIEGEAAPKSKIEEINLGIATAEAKLKVVRKQIENTSIKAPMSGIMTYRVVERGGVIGLGIQVAQLTDISSLKLMVRVPEADVLTLKKGMKATVLADVYPDKSLTGTVTNVGIKADESFTYDVEILCPNPNQSPLKAGMHASATFQLSAQRKNGFTLPRSAIAGSLQEGKIFIVQSDSTVIEKKLTLGQTESNKVEVLAGLDGTESVVVSGQINLVEGAKVKVVE